MLVSTRTRLHCRNCRRLANEVEALAQDLLGMRPDLRRRQPVFGQPERKEGLEYPHHPEHAGVVDGDAQAGIAARQGGNVGHSALPYTVLQGKACLIAGLCASRHTISV